MSEEAMEREVLFTVEAGVGRILLNRPKALNALTLDKIREMTATLKAWAQDDAVHCVVVEGAGEKAFCAGGDIRRLWEANRDQDESYIQAFFGDEYQLNRLIKVYEKPYVALMDGITMGGGVGVSVHGSHRVATERTLFAMPESGIGLVPDVGGTYFLPRLPGKIGMYMGLTGARLKAADCYYTGLATHYIPTARRDDLLQALAEAESDTKTPEEMQTAVTCVLDMFHEDPGSAPLERQQEQIDRCFGGASVEEIIGALKSDGSEWALKQLQILESKAPTATKAAFQQIQIGLQLDFDRCMQTEYRLSTRLAHTGDFAEGVRAIIVDKDNAPKWQPATVSDVEQETVDGLFAPLPDGDIQF